MKALPVRAGTAFFLLLPVILLCFSLAGCSLERTGGRKDRTEVTWETVEEADVPEDMKKEIEKQKEKPFQITWGDGEWLYIGKGYGSQPTEGYQIEVEGLWESGDFLCVDTRLDGPATGTEPEEKESYPWLVIRTGWTEKTVVFE